ncbi:MAG: ferrochelatase [Deltaproteobacteria bacterium]|nr:ferrochelatase [Deltaproteobacteria bacterium]
MTLNQDTFDAVLVIAFGGPEKVEDIRPFLRNVTQGRIPAERLESVARHYELFGGRSPVKEVTLRQAHALKATLKNHGMPLAVYVGMRNWHPLLEDTVQQMSRDGVNRAVGLIMSVYQSRSSWDQYQTDVANAIAKAGVDLSIEYTGPLFDHPGFIEAVSNQVKHCLEQLPAPDRQAAHILFTAHSIPHSDPKVELYAKQVDDSGAFVARKIDHANWQRAYQSRSGRPQDSWLEPDVNDVLRELGVRGVKHVVVVPIGFVSDNIEVLYDLDIEAMETARQAGITLLRAKTASDDQVFVNGLADLVTRVLGRYL